MNKNRFLLTSESIIKTSVVKDIFKIGESESFSLDCKGIPSKQIPDNVEQPIGIGGLVCCKNRIIAALDTLRGNVVNKYDGIISIENSVTYDKSKGYYDEVHVIVYDTANEIYYHQSGSPVYFEQMYYDLAATKSTMFTKLGMDYTIGEVMKDCNSDIDHKNWIKSVKCIKKNKTLDRHVQIHNVLRDVMLRFFENKIGVCDLKVNLGYHLDFKKGVVFKDIAPVLSKKNLYRLFINESLKVIKHNIKDNIDCVVGVGDRGFYVGPVLAERLNSSFIPIRKKGKLPGYTISRKYSTEYSSDEMEIQPQLFDQFEKQNVLIVDDLVATGGSLGCAVDLVKMSGKNLNIVGCFCPLVVEDLLTLANRNIEERQKVKLITLNL